jgi:Ca2+-binding EF-hand superfamily protein
MKAIQLLAGVGFAALIACTPVLAQDMPPPPPGAGGHDMAGHDMRDRGDRPGRRPHRAPLTRADLEKMVTEHFAAIDINHDGVITRAELDNARDARHARMEAEREAAIKAHLTKRFDRLDTNHDGAISREEFAAAAAPPPPPGAPGEGPPPGGPGKMAERGPGEPGVMWHKRMEHGPMDRQAMRGPHGPMGGPEMMMGSRWLDLVLDAHDGKASLGDVKKSALAMFDRLDTNHDGTITPDERRMAFRTMRWRGPGFGRGGPPQPPAKG